jgi:hypothetical protein
MKIQLTPEAKAALQNQFALLEFRRPALYLHRASASGDVTRSPDGRVNWSVERPQRISLNFAELPRDTVEGHEGIQTVDGIRVAFLFSPPTDDLEIAVRDGELFVNILPARDVHGREKAEGQAPRGTPMGLLLRKEVLSSAGLDRLRRFDIARGDSGFDFHSLQWDRFHAGSWLPELTLTQSQFQGSSPLRRWVSDVDSIEPSAGIAILKVAEGNRPYSAMRSITFLYSWRAWDLRSNVEVQRLKDCDDPFEPLN